MALGASASRVRAMIVRQGMTLAVALAVAGLLIGIVVAFALARLLKT